MGRRDIVGIERALRGQRSEQRGADRRRVELQAGEDRRGAERPSITRSRRRRASRPRSAQRSHAAAMRATASSPYTGRRPSSHSATACGAPAPAPRGGPHIADYTSRIAPRRRRGGCVGETKRPRCGVPPRLRRQCQLAHLVRVRCASPSRCAPRCRGAGWRSRAVRRRCSRCDAPSCRRSGTGGPCGRRRGRRTCGARSCFGAVDEQAPSPTSEPSGVNQSTRM